jgi:hypothetical protein
VLVTTIYLSPPSEQIGLERARAPPVGAIMRAQSARLTLNATRTGRTYIIKTRSQGARAYTVVVYFSISLLK